MKGERQSWKAIKIAPKTAVTIVFTSETRSLCDWYLFNWHSFHMRKFNMLFARTFSELSSEPFHSQAALLAKLAPLDALDCREIFSFSRLDPFSIVSFTGFMVNGGNFFLRKNYPSWEKCVVYNYSFSNPVCLRVAELQLDSSYCKLS